MSFAGAVFLVKASTKTTAGGFTIIEELDPLDTPLHVHANEDELFDVIEGEHVFRVGEEEFRLARGPSSLRRDTCSDLPLQGGYRVNTAQMAQAIAFVLRERGFGAGRFRVAYQSCDDSLARTGLLDEGKCAAKARAYARSPLAPPPLRPLRSAAQPTAPQPDASVSYAVSRQTPTVTIL